MSQNQKKQVAAIGLVERASGIVVPGNLAAEPEVNAPNGKHGPPVCYDPDGRRRVVFPKALQKKVNSLVLDLVAQGFGMVVICRSEQKHGDKQGCGMPLLNEGQGQPDDGYGCRCSRIHFQD